MNKTEAKKYCKCLRENSCQKECRNHIDYPDEYNCVLVTVRENDDMSLRDVAERMGLSHVRIMQIEKKALEKLSKRIMNE